MGTAIKEVLDIARNLDAFKGALKLAGKDIVFTPGLGVLDLPPSVESSLSYWSGLLISFNYVVNVGDTISVWPFGQPPVHWIDTSGIKGTQTQRSYYRYLQSNHPDRFKEPDNLKKRELPPVRKKYNEPGKGIPDIMTTRTKSGDALKHYYEIKPDNPQGEADGKDKLQRITQTLERFSLEKFYAPGVQKHIEPLSMKVYEATVGAANFAVFLEQRLKPDGLILYKFRVSFSLDPGPFLTKAAIALAVVAVIEGGAMALSRAAGTAAGPSVAKTAEQVAEEAGTKKIRVELLKRLAEESGSPAVREFVGELGSDGIIEHGVKKAASIPKR
jgi:hypothetical protein